MVFFSVDVKDCDVLSDPYFVDFCFHLLDSCIRRLRRLNRGSNTDSRNPDGQYEHKNDRDQTFVEHGFYPPYTTIASASMTANSLWQIGCRGGRGATSSLFDYSIDAG